MYQASLALSNAVPKFAALVAAMLPSLAYAGAFTPTYTLTDLGLLPGSTEAISVKINDRGDAIGTAIGNNDKGVLFHRHTVVDVVPSATSSFVSGINSSSQIAGYFYNGVVWQGFIYNKGTVTGFNVPGSNQTVAESINDFGQVAGCYSPANTPINSADHIFVRQTDGAFTDLGEFGTDPSALAINNAGRVLIGVYGLNTPTGNTFISRPGSKSMEQVPSLIPGGLVSPGDMNQFGEVTGWAATDVNDVNEHAFVYFAGKLKDLGVLARGDDTWGYGINNLGQVVGGAYQAAKLIKDAKGNVIGETPEVSHGWVDLDGTLRDVNGLLNTSGKGWVISEARSINDLGRVLANANLNGGPTHVVELTPNGVLPNLVP